MWKAFWKRPRDECFTDDYIKLSFLYVAYSYLPWLAKKTATESEKSGCIALSLKSVVVSCEIKLLFSVMKR